VTADERPRLLAVEDDARLGPLLVEVLETVYDVELVTDGVAGLAAAMRGDFEVAVIDRRLPGLDGVALISELRRTGSALPVLMLTALGTVPDRVSGLDAGADDYLVKPFDFDELHARLRALLRVHSAPVTHIGEWEFQPARNAIHSPYEGRVALTPRETALLELLAGEPERAFSRETILRRVFDPDAGPGTVDTYVHAIRRKTERDLIETVRGTGYRIGAL
jgi:two-component system response regulator QseB